MAIFSYKARDSRGKSVEGIVDGANEEAVAGLLADKGLAVISITAREAGGRLAAAGFGFMNRVRGKDLVIFFRQLSVMVEANIPIVRGLKILTKQTSNKYLKLIIATIADEVEGGAKLSQAMKSFPDVFGDFFTNVISSGETSGRLSEVMNYIADQQEKDYDLKAKVQGAMTYPLIIVGGLFIVGFIVITFVIPKMTGILLESGVQLPFITKMLIWISDFFSHFWWLILILLIGAFVGLRIYLRRSASGMKAVDLIKLKIPVFGIILQYIAITRICRTLSTLIKGGVPLAKALETVRDVADNSVYREVLDKTIEDVEEGNSLADSWARSGHMPMMVSQMVSVGEESGKLELTLEKVTEFYTREVDNRVANLSTLIEPIVMIILGIAVGGFVAAVILPMWQLSTAM